MKLREDYTTGKLKGLSWRSDAQKDLCTRVRGSEPQQSSRMSRRHQILHPKAKHSQQRPQDGHGAKQSRSFRQISAKQALCITLSYRLQRFHTLKKLDLSFSTRHASLISLNCSSPVRPVRRHNLLVSITARTDRYILSTVPTVVNLFHMST